MKIIYVNCGVKNYMQTIAAIYIDTVFIRISAQP